MNFQRIAMAAVAAWIVDMVYGFIVFGNLMAGMFADPALHPEAEMNLALGFASSFIGFFVFSYIYAKGYEGGQGLMEGIRFGMLIALLFLFFSMIWNHVLFRVSEAFTVYTSIAGVVEFLLAGLVVGAVYRPIGVPVRRAV